MKKVSIAKTQEAATKFVEDKIKPELDSFGLNMDKETLTLEFSEAVDVSTFNVKELTLQAKAGTSSSVKLSGGTTKSINGVQVVVDLISTDLDKIKLAEDLATGTTNTHLTITAAGIKDMNKNSLVKKSLPLCSEGFFVRQGLHRGNAQQGHAGYGHRCADANVLRDDGRVVAGREVERGASVESEHDWRDGGETHTARRTINGSV
jgi:hypothetical protein